MEDTVMNDFKDKLLKEGKSKNTVTAYCSQLKNLMKDIGVLELGQLLKLKRGMVEDCIQREPASATKQARMNAYHIALSLYEKPVEKEVIKKEVVIKKDEFDDKCKVFLERESNTVRSLIVALFSRCECLPYTYMLEDCEIVDTEQFEKLKMDTVHSLFDKERLILFVPKKLLKNKSRVGQYDFGGLDKWIRFPSEQKWLFEKLNGESHKKQAINDNIRRAFKSALNIDLGMLDIKRIGSP